MPRELLRVVLVGFSCIQAATSSATPTDITALYDWYCVGEKALSFLCQRRRITRALKEEKDREARMKLIKEMRDSTAEARASNGGTLSTAKLFQDMKQAFCASSEGKSKALCIPGAMKMPSNLRSTSTKEARSTSTKEAIGWFCAKPAKMESATCKRYALMAKIRAAKPDERRELQNELKEIPTTPYGYIQDIVTDWCKLPDNIGVSSCIRLKRSQQYMEINTWYCAKSSHSEEANCRRRAIMEEMRKKPEKYTELRKQLSELMHEQNREQMKKGKTAPSNLALDMKKLFCAEFPDKPVCSDKPVPGTYPSSQ